VIFLVVILSGLEIMDIHLLFHQIVRTSTLNIGPNLPDELRTYCAVFVYLGVFPNNYVILRNSPEALKLVGFANCGCRIYIWRV
jgi:hypothetical protein